jgi:large subunit ribosomal protein L30
MAEEKKNRKIAVVRIRGEVDVKRGIKETLSMLNLKHANWVTFLSDTPTNMGMLRKVKDFVTWGEVDDKLFEKLIIKWGRKAADKRLDEKDAKKFVADFLSSKTSFREAGVKPYIRLHPPAKGHERGGIKTHFNVGGSLGYRGEKINELLAKMAGIKLKDGSKE